MKKLFTPDFLMVPYELLERQKLSPADWIVFSVVYWFEHLKDGRCTAANETIGAIAKLDERTVRRSLEKLEKEGLVKRIFLDGQRKKRKMIKVLLSFKSDSTMIRSDNASDSIGRKNPTVGLNDPTTVGQNDPQNKNINKKNLIRNNLYFQKQALVKKFSMKNYE